MKQVIKQADILNHTPGEVYQIICNFKQILTGIKTAEEVIDGEYYHYYLNGKEIFTIQVTNKIAGLMVVFHFKGIHQEGTLSIQLASLNETSTRIYFTSFFDSLDYLGKAELAFNRLAIYVDDIELNIRNALKNG